MTASRVLGVGSRIQKLRAMSASEVIHRVRYCGVVEVERRRHRAGRLTEQDRLRRAIGELGVGTDWSRRLMAARRSHHDRFFQSVYEPEAIRDLFGTRYINEAAETARHANDARAHRFSFFGQTFAYGDDIPWQTDPVTGSRWPKVYHADVPVHGGDVGYGDVKHVWELNRQQFLIDLGKSWFLWQNAEDAEAIRHLVRSWIAGNPYATGVNWASALEPAFRVFSWLWTYYLTLEQIDDEFHVEWLQSFYDHGRFLERHLEHYSSPYNHLIAETAALYMLGACFPEFADSERWRAVGKSVMTDRLAEQFYPDGGSVEQSTFYHHATVGFYLLAGLTARATGDDLAPEIWSAIERGLDFSLTLSQPDGSTPSIGGADDGKPIRMEQLPLWDFRPYLAIGAVIFGRADFKWVAGRFHEDALWLMGTTGLQAFDRLEATPPRGGSSALAASGYVVLRSDFGEQTDYVCFDCGEQAAGMRHDAVPNSMHGHADCLSVVAWLGGKRTLVDSGFYAYNCGGEWEAHFRETAAHNTVRIDGRDQARHIRKMAWSHSYRATLEGWRDEGVCAWAIGSHDGYARGPDGIRHRRVVYLRPNNYLVIADELEGTGTHEIEVIYQFAPGTLVAAAPHRALFDDAVELVWSGGNTWEAATTCGGPGPADGWIAPSLGVRVPAPRLTLRRHTNRRQTSLLTILASRTSADMVSLLDLSEPDSERPLLAVVGKDAVDVIASGERPDADPIRSDALIVVCRVPTMGNIETRQIGGSIVEVDTDALRRLVAKRLSAAEKRQ